VLDNPLKSFDLDHCESARDALSDEERSASQPSQRSNARRIRV